jgi:5-methylcytosine-specific restriction endonuclease McrA
MSSLPEVKVCTKCGVEKGIEEFYVKYKKTGRRFARCKACHRAETLANYKAGGEEAKAKHLAYYHANKDERGDYAARYRAENKEKCAAAARRSRQAKLEEYRQRERAYKEANRETLRVKNREYKERNKDYVRQQDAAYRQKNRQLIRERHKVWRDANPERWAEICRKWKQANRELVRAAGHRRRARLSESAENYTPEEWAALKAAVDWTCLMCGRKEPEIKLTVDHIVPVSKGGGNGIHQIQPLCFECNNFKQTRIMDFRPEHLKTPPQE